MFFDNIKSYRVSWRTMIVATVVELCSSRHRWCCSEIYYVSVLSANDGYYGGTDLWEWEVWPRGWARGNSVMGAPILMYFSDILRHCRALLRGHTGHTGHPLHTIVTSGHPLPIRSLPYIWKYSWLGLNKSMKSLKFGSRKFAPEVSANKIDKIKFAKFLLNITTFKNFYHF